MKVKKITLKKSSEKRNTPFKHIKNDRKKRVAYLACKEDCFNCQYDDCKVA